MAGRPKYYILDDQGRKCYTDGPGKPPIFVQAIIDKQKMTLMEFFHITDAYLDWDKKGDDEAVLEPLIAFLAKWGDDIIFAFEDKMAEILYSLDRRKFANHIFKGKPFSAEEFLHTRCVALVNGKQYYSDIISGSIRMVGGLEFEAVLYAPVFAWARCHLRAPEAYPHVPPFSYESMSNKEAWLEVTPELLAKFISAKAKERLSVQQVVCSCGCQEFRVRQDAGRGAVQLTCSKCEAERLVFTSPEFWQACRPRRRKCGNCRNDILRVSVGVTQRPKGLRQHVYFGAHCVNCDELFMLSNWPLD